MFFTKTIINQALDYGYEKKYFPDNKKITTNFKQDSISKIETLTNYEAVLEAAKSTGYITEEVMPTLREWRANPSEWRNDLK